MISTLSIAETKSNLSTQQITNNFQQSIVRNSADARKNKKFSVDLSLIGVQFNTSSYGIEGSYFLDSDTVISVEAILLSNYGITPKNTEGQDLNNSISDETDNLWQENGEGYAIGVNFKRFLTNTLYLKGGGYYRNQKIVSSTASIGGVLIESESDFGEVNDLGASLSVGNQWQWKNFTIGADWIGFNQSLLILEQNSSNDFSTSDISSLNLLSLYIGYSY